MANCCQNVRGNKTNKDQHDNKKQTKQNVLVLVVALFLLLFVVSSWDDDVPQFAPMSTLPLTKTWG